MSTKQPKFPSAIPALKVHQWLGEWNEILFDARMRRAKPNPFFYLFSIPARDLRALCGIYPRSTAGRKRGTEDLGIQRRHDKERSDEIREFVRYGHPWAGLSEAKRDSGEYTDLKKPGWLPTAIVVNILKPGAERLDKAILAADALRIEDRGTQTTVLLPNNYDGPDWQSSSRPPIEVIDGQHRLWAFDQFDFDGQYDLPVVAFHGLDISWQAYLFYTINIKPKRINASLAFDLYPLLRTEDWLEKFEGAAIYRETRAQELVDLLYSHPESPWHNRINMLGEKGGRGEMVTQAAWVRSLLATFVKSWEGKRVSIGGLFGAPVGSHKQVLPWSRHEQAAFLVCLGQKFNAAVEHCDYDWAKSLRQNKQSEMFHIEGDQALWGRHSLISQDQGIRGLLNVANDLCYMGADELGLSDWGRGASDGGTDHELVSQALAALKRAPVCLFLAKLAQELAKFDWRASSAPGLTESESLMKGAFRGSGGYRDFRRQLLLHLSGSKGDISTLASKAITTLGYE